LNFAAARWFRHREPAGKSFNHRFAAAVFLLPNQKVPVPEAGTFCLPRLPRFARFSLSPARFVINSQMAETNPASEPIKPGSNGRFPAGFTNKGVNNE
jgi:hypothetical protein